MFDDIDTPALLLDRDKLERNCRRMRERLHSHGVVLRPHVKTAKSVEVAQIALDAPIGRDHRLDRCARRNISSTTASATSSTRWAWCPARCARVAELTRRGARVSAIVDSVEGARALGGACDKVGVRIPTLVEIDSDGHRAGIAPGDARLLDVAEALGESLLGVMTHAGDSYNCAATGRSGAWRRASAKRWSSSAAALRARGHACPVVSVGSTPTATFAESFAGVTEVRTGVYVFHDLVMAGLGVCAVDDIAISVLASVIGHQRDKNWILTDAGWMALSRDRGTARQKVDQGYGVVCDAAGQPIEDLIVADANQEHGIIARRDGGPIDFTRFPIGSLVRILPNHACATAAQHAEYQVLRNGRVRRDLGTLRRLVRGWALFFLFLTYFYSGKPCLKKLKRREKPARGKVAKNPGGFCDARSKRGVKNAEAGDRDRPVRGAPRRRPPFPTIPIPSPLFFEDRVHPHNAQLAEARASIRSSG